jgi:hypothetical protein
MADLTAPPKDATPKVATTTPPYLTVYTLDRTHSEYSFSPFATKLRFRLRHAGIPYVDAMGKMHQSLKTKIPYVKFEGSSEFMGDSALIIERLCKEGRMERVNEGLAPQAKAMDLCLRSMLEDRMYFFLVS